MLISIVETRWRLATTDFKMMSPDKRRKIVRAFIQLGRVLELVVPGEIPSAENEMAMLVRTFDRELFHIAATAEGDEELQLAAWLKNLASLPNGSTGRSEYTWIRASLSLSPRPRGSGVLEAAVYLPSRRLEVSEG